MEYGTDTMPGRPVFEPTMEEVKADFAKFSGYALKDLNATWGKK
jgi:hypothetical protein